MKLTTIVLIVAFTVVTFLRTLQGMSINTNKPANTVQPTAANSSDATVVQALIKAYWDKDKTKLHRFLSILLPMVSREFHVESVDDLLAYLEERNITTNTENNKNHEILNSNQKDIDDSHNATEANATGVSSISFNNSSSNNVDGSLKSSMRSRKYPSTRDEVVHANRKHKPIEKHRETAVDPGQMMHPHSLQAGGIKPLSETNNISLQFNNIETQNKQESEKTQVHSALDREETVNSVKFEESSSTVGLSKPSVNNNICNKLPSSMKSNEPAFVCSPKEIMDILIESLAPAVVNNSHSNWIPSNRLEHTLNTNANIPFPPQFVEDTFKQSRFPASVKELKVNLMNESLDELLPLSLPPKDHVDVPPSKKHKYKHKDVAIHGTHLKHPSLLVAQRNSTLYHINQSRSHKSKHYPNNMNNFENQINMSRIVTTPLEERSINHSSKSIVNDLVSKESPEISLVSEYVSTDNPPGSVSSSSPINENLIVSPPRDGVDISQYKPSLNVSLVNLIVHSREDTSLPSPSIPRRVTPYSSTLTTTEGASTHNESRPRNISFMSSTDDSLTNLTISSKPRKLAGDLFHIEFKDTLDDKEKEFKTSRKMTANFLENASEELENSSDFNSRQDRATVANYTRKSSLLLDDGDDAMLKSGLKAGLTTTGSYRSHPEHEATFRGDRAEDARQSTLSTLRQGITRGDDEPLRISFRQAEYKPSLFRFNTSSFRLDHPLDAYIDEQDEYLQESWEDPAEDVTYECDPDNAFDDVFSSSRSSEQNGCEDISSQSNHHEAGSHLNPVTSANFASGLGDPVDRDYLNVTRRSSPAYTAWPSTCQPYYLPLSYYWQYYQNSWPSSNYVTYNVPPFFCPPCPRNCSDPPAKPRPSVCPPCPQLFSAAQYSPPHPKQCPRPRPPRPPYCKNCCPPKACPPCPKWCVSPKSPPRPQGCAPCPLLPQCNICPNCGANIAPPVPCFCPFCNKPNYPTPSYNTGPYTNSRGYPNTYVSNPSSSPVNTNGCQLNYEISCPACPDECVFRNYPPRPPSCPPCPAKPPCNRPAPFPFCRPCPVDCVPDDYPPRRYGCIPCPPLPQCSC